MLVRLTLACAIVQLTFAQVDANKGAIYGIVTDMTGAAIPDANVLAIQTASGLEREATTDSNGQYRLPLLLPGEYEIRVTAGVVGAAVREVPVRVGAAVQVNVSVVLQSASQPVNVAASVLSIADAGLTQVVPFTAIRDLPINGRRFQDFATLTPGVQAGPETLGQLSFVGQRGVNSNVMVDGTDYNEPFLGGIRGGDRSTMAFTIPQSGIAEFQAVTTGYSAEYGRSTDGILNAITRSGGNSYHGEALYLVRDGQLAAESPFGQNPLDRQHQFGGGIGGPVVRDRLFFFGAAEQQFAKFPRQVRFGQLANVQSTADIAPALDFFQSQERSFEQTNDATAVLGRGDWHFGDHALAGRYQYTRNQADNAIALGMSPEPVTNRALNSNGWGWDAIRTVGGQLTSAFTPAFLNDFRVQHSFEHRRRVPNALAPRVEAGSVGTIGTPALLPYRLRDHRLQFADGVTVLTGSHAVKFGFDYSYINFYQWFGDNQTGAFTVAGADVTDILRILSRNGGVEGNRFDDPSVVYRRQVGVLALQDVAHQIAFFVQDTWRVHRSVTLNAGLRWEGQLNPAPNTSNTALAGAVRDFTYPLGSVDPSKLRDNLRQWAPRLGIAWNPGNGATVIRAQTGLFYGQTPLTLLIGPLGSFSTTPPDLSVEVAPGQRGTVYQQFLAAGIDLNRTSLDKLPVVTPVNAQRINGGADAFVGANVVTTSGDNFRNPRSAQFSFGVQHQVSKGITADYQLNYVNTVHLVRNVDYNVPRPMVRAGDASERAYFGLRSGAARPNPAIGQLLVRDAGAKARYTGHSFRLQWTGARLEGAANYTLSFNKSDDDSERALTGIGYGNPFDFSREYNWSALDARHLASAYILLRGPYGFDVSSVFRYRSGLPIDPTTGTDSAELLSGSVGNRPYERPGVPFLRNSFRNRDFKTVDVRLLKTILQKENLRVQLSGELFNALNFDNVAFLGPTALSENPAFQYGPGILTNGQMAPIAPGFLRLRSADGRYDPAVSGQQGSPLQAQLGIRVLF